MKHLKMLGLAAAAAAVMAFVGAGSASATVICKTEPVGGVCPEGWDYPAGTKGVASLQGTASMETTGGTVLDTCTASTVEGTSENTGSATTTVKSTLTTLTFGTGAEPCSKTTTTLNPGTGELHWIPGTNNGTLTTFNTKVTINTIFGSCVYGASAAGTHMGTTVGGNPGSLTLEAISPLIEGSGLCPTDVRVTGKYVATSPTNAWVAER